LGHARVLTSHRDVIHYARAASLPLPYKMGAPIFFPNCGTAQRHSNISKQTFFKKVLGGVGTFFQEGSDKKQKIKNIVHFVLE
ncbi:MAG: hypothetical protein IJZ80_03625, partial [Clostridia bacterium]|nr:hypothetical protein [Clostridia bacterium]